MSDEPAPAGPGSRAPDPNGARSVDPSAGDPVPSSSALAVGIRSPRARLEAGLLALASITVIALALQPWATSPLSTLEACAVVSLAWSVWLLAWNHPSGWIAGLFGVAFYGALFYEVKLYGEVGLQVFYFVTSLQAVWVWLRSGPAREERPVGRVSKTWWAVSAALGLVAFVALRALLLDREGAAPTWDALTTVLSVIAHLYLMARTVDSWPLWIAVDTIYVPLYASRGLHFTAGLYVVFWVLAVRGFFMFRRLHAERLEADEQRAADLRSEIAAT